MNGSDYIKKAVELAGGWERKQFGYFLVPNSHKLPNGSKRKIAHGPGLDALAAQLVRQVDALGGPWFEFTRQSNGQFQCCLFVSPDYPPVVWNGNDRTENTIKAIVDSGVLG